MYYQRPWDGSEHFIRLLFDELDLVLSEAVGWK